VYKRPQSRRSRLLISLVGFRSPDCGAQKARIVGKPAVKRCVEGTRPDIRCLEFCGPSVRSTQASGTLLRAFDRPVSENP
jgi:hypothetical protein